MMLPASVLAQFNTDRLVTIGRSALYYEDYVLSMQYFNQAINAKPYLYEPWFFRGVAKFYLDDFVGAEADCTEAIKRNPFVVNIYDLRGLTRIHQKKYNLAIADYTKALEYAPDNKSMWHNRVFCRISSNDYDGALADLDTMLARWSTYVPAYSMRARAYLLKADTLNAMAAVDRALELAPYDDASWEVKAVVALSRKQWKDAETALDNVIKIRPKQDGNYVNRALARFNLNNLRGAMADYDMALDLNPNSFLAHYNRGLLRAQVGDDNRAILDFDFVLKHDPENLMALYNRGLLLDKTGNLRGAIRDYSKVIDKFPNFWVGREKRAACYRRLGMVKKAEADEGYVFKQRLYKTLYGIQPRLDKKQIRKWSDVDLDKYNQLATTDEEEAGQNYVSEYRGRVQNRAVDESLMPMFGLSFELPANEVRSNVAFDRQVEAFNSSCPQCRRVYITASQPALGDKQAKGYFQYIDSVSAALSAAGTAADRQALLLRRAIAYTMIRDMEKAYHDLTTLMRADSLSALAPWQRAVCQTGMNDFNASLGTDVDMKTANVLSDLTVAIRLNRQNAYLLYNRGNANAARKDFAAAIADYTAAIAADASLAEAYYNRGIVLLRQGKTAEATIDLSKAGELGLYKAYGIIKKHGKKQ